MKEKKFVETFCTECGKKIVLEERTLRDKRRTGKCQSCSLLGNKNHTTYYSFRRQNKMTLKEMGEKIGVSLGTVWRWEREVKRNEQKETTAA